MHDNEGRLVAEARAKTLLGSYILIVEDDHLVAADIIDAFEQAGATVIGPLSSIQDALWEADCAVRLDGALLNVSIRDQMGWALADTLLSRDVPIAFAIGSEPHLLGERCASVPAFSAPNMLSMVVDWLVAKIAAKAIAGALFAPAASMPGRLQQANQPL